MEVRPSQPTTKASPDMFTGEAWYDVLVRGESPSRIRVSLVRFAPGARNAWHRHPMGQTLHVTDGLGRCQARGGGIIENPYRRYRHHSARGMALAWGRTRPLHDAPGDVGGAR